MPMNILKIIKEYLRKKNPDYTKLFKQHGLGQTLIGDKLILEIFHDAAVYYKVSITSNYSGGSSKAYRRMRHRIDGPAYIPKYIDVKSREAQNHWFHNGEDITDLISIWATLNEIDLDNLTDTDKLLIRVQFLKEFGLSEEDNDPKNMYIKQVTPVNPNFSIIPTGNLYPTDQSNTQINKSYLTIK